jgi:hypothetical protein
LIGVRREIFVSVCLEKLTEQGNAEPVWPQAFDGIAHGATLDDVVRKARAAMNRPQVSAVASASWISVRRRSTRSELCLVRGDELIEQSQDGGMVAVVVQVLQAVAELWMPHVHHLLHSVLRSIGKTVLTGSELVGSATKRTDRTEAVRSLVCRIDGARLVAYGDLALYPAVVIRNDRAGARDDLVMEWFGH